MAEAAPSFFRPALEPCSYSLNAYATTAYCALRTAHLALHEALAHFGGVALDLACSTRGLRWGQGHRARVWVGVRTGAGVRALVRLKLGLGL